jgi:tetratricopeptide (TPR) repeat protein
MTRPDYRFARGAFVPALLLGATACTPLFDRPKLVEIQPVETPSADGTAADDDAYRSATTAIDNRDYTLALEHLQAARERQPHDVRVLNAFGVIYDKLGRFDLSARYYAQAMAIDPRSKIVLGNIAYSRALLGLENHEPVTNALAEAIPLRPDAAHPEPAPELRAAVNPGSASLTPAAAGLGAQPDAHSGDARLGVVPALAELPAQHSEQAAVKLTGHPLSIVNASGIKGATDAMRRRLIHLGWTAPRWAAREGAGASHTTLLYAQPNVDVARALVRTLRFSIHLASRSCGCGGLELVVGTDFLHRSALTDDLELDRNDPGGVGVADPTTSTERDHVPAKT